MDDIKELFLQGENKLTKLSGDGDFRSDECIEILKEADIVVTNPPFSLFREYVGQLMEHNKNFLIIGTMNAITYKEIFPLLKDNKMWIGYNSPKEFVQPDMTVKKFGNILWYTNLDIKKRHEEAILFRKYDPEAYPKYYNYDAINVDKVADMPMDYDGVMGVPITFITNSYTPDQFEIIGLGIANLGLECGVKPYEPRHKKYRKEVQQRGQVDGDLYMVDENDHPVVPYARILIRNRHPEI